MNEGPLISIIVPVYNVEKYLNRCIKSILRQTYRNYELLLIDDGSPDNCPVLCDEWAKKDSRSRVFHKQNGGLSDARNYGIQRANARFFTRKKEKQLSKMAWNSAVSSGIYQFADYTSVQGGGGSGLNICVFLFLKPKQVLT